MKARRALLWLTYAALAAANGQHQEEVKGQEVAKDWQPQRGNEPDEPEEPERVHVRDAGHQAGPERVVIQEEGGQIVDVEVDAIDDDDFHVDDQPEEDVDDYFFNHFMPYPPADAVLDHPARDPPERELEPRLEEERQQQQEEPQQQHQPPPHEAVIEQAWRPEIERGSEPDLDALVDAMRREELPEVEAVVAEDKNDDEIVQPDRTIIDQVDFTEKAEPALAANAPEVKIHEEAQSMLRERQERPDNRVLVDGVDLLGDLRAAMTRQRPEETNKTAKACQDNEVYIVEGDKTLLLTNNRVAKDIDAIQETEKNLLMQLERQDKLLELLKQRLNYSETQMDESMRVLSAQVSDNDRQKLE